MIISVVIKYIGKKHWGFPDGIVIKNPPANAGDIRDTSLIPQLGWSPGEGNGNSLQYPCLENSMDRGARSLTGYSSWDFKESNMTERLSTHAHIHTHAHTHTHTTQKDRSFEIVDHIETLEIDISNKQMQKDKKRERKKHGNKTF